MPEAELKALPAQARAGRRVTLKRSGLGLDLTSGEARIAVSRGTETVSPRTATLQAAPVCACRGTCYVRGIPRAGWHGNRRK